MNTKDILIAAKAVIEDPANWTTKSLARTASGMPRLPGDPQATCFCSTGAVAKVCYGAESFGKEEAIKALNTAASVLTDGKCRRAFVYNDNRTHDAVMKMFDTAIAAQE